LGGFVLETAGACWALPEFHFKMQARVELILSLRKMLRTSPQLNPPAPVVKQKGGAGGGLESARSKGGQESARSTSSTSSKGSDGSSFSKGSCHSSDGLKATPSTAPDGKPSTAPDGKPKPPLAGAVLGAPTMAMKMPPGMGGGGGGAGAGSGAGLATNTSTKTPPLGGKGGVPGLSGAVQPTAGQQLGRYGDILKELWGPGGPLNNIALAQARRAAVPATAPDGLLLQHLRELARELSAVFLSPYARHELAMSTPRADKRPSLIACRWPLMASDGL